jgi:hypothetical protein
MAECPVKRLVEEPMKMRLVLSGLAAGAVMLSAGAAFSGGITTNTAQLVSFDSSTGELWAVPSGQNLTSYLNQKVTAYVAADLRLFEPPDPCFPPVAAWNFTVAYDQRHHTHSTFIYELLLGVMSDLQCSANVTSSTNGTPQPLVAITPTK